MKRFLFATVTCAALLAGAALLAQRPKETPSWAPKPDARTPYVPPMKPHTRISEVMAKHKGEKEWSETVVDDNTTTSGYVYSQPGTKVSRRFHPDTRCWWIVLDGEIKFEIEGQSTVMAKKGSMVQVPAQTIFSLETVGNAPSLRYEVNIAKAHTLYPQDVTPPKTPGIQFIPVTLNRTPFPYGATNKPEINLFEIAKDMIAKGSGSAQTRFIHDDRAVANAIYGFEKSLGPLNEKNRGHYHTECAEYWLIMAGQVRYPIEGVGVVIASEGDVVYVPPFTFHAPRFHGEKFACRLAMNGYTNIAHLFDAPH